MFFIVSSEYETNGGDISEIIKRIDKELKISTDYVSDNNETFRYGYRIYEPMEYKIFKKNVKEAGYKFPPPHSETFLPHLNPVSKIIVTELVAILKEKRKNIKKFKKKIEIDSLSFFFYKESNKHEFINKQTSYC